MPKITPEAAPAAKPARTMAVKTIVYCAMLAAIQVVLARLIIPMPAADTRFSIEAVPVFLAGALFGPLPGALVGFASDVVGCLFSGYGYNPMLCIPPLLYGACGGWFRYYISEKPNFWRVLLGFMPAVVLGSFLIQSTLLAYVYNAQGAFLQSWGIKLAARGIQFAITWPIEAAIVTLLFKAKVFNRLKVWPPRPRTKNTGLFSAAHTKK